MPTQPSALSNTVLAERYQGYPQYILEAASDNIYFNPQQIDI